MNSVRLAFTEHGPKEGQPILLSGSLGSTQAMWGEQVSTLKERARVITFDHRGHGGSPTPLGPYTLDDLGMDTLALMDELGLDQVDFVGLSLGGMVGMWIAENAPMRLNKLVLMCCAAKVDDVAPWMDRARAAREHGTASIAPMVASRWLTPEFAETHPEIEQTLVAMIANTTDEGYAGCCEAIATMNLQDQLNTIDAQTLVIAAAQDPSTPAETTVAPIAQGIVNSQYVVVDDAAHLVNVQQPALVNGLLTGFLLD